jgi:U5 snRNP spliceosome subunit
MHGQSGVSQEWSLHAQLTISHHQPASGAAPDIPPPPATSAPQPTEHNSPGVHMRYSWGEQPTSSPPPPPPPQPPPSLNIPPRTCYGFQRGNILFTTRPPPQETHPASTSVLRSVPHLLDSGYSSEQVSPGSYASLPTRRSAQPYSRRCKSTCSIVLSGAEHQGVASASMRPNVDSGLVGHDDLGCFHHRQTSPFPNHKQGRPRSSDFGPVPEVCEVCGGGRSPTAIRRAAAANTFTTHFCTHVPERLLRDVDKSSRDVASQTTDNLTRATSTGKGETSACRSKPVQPKMGNKVVYGGIRRKTDSELLQVPVINVPEPDTELIKVSLQIASLMLVKCRVCEMDRMVLCAGRKSFICY